MTITRRGRNQHSMAFQTPLLVQTIIKVVWGVVGVCATVRGGAGWVGGATTGLGRHRVGQGLVEAGRRSACRIVWAGQGDLGLGGAGRGRRAVQGRAGKWQGCWWWVGWGGMNGVRVGGVGGAG